MYGHEIEDDLSLHSHHVDTHSSSKKFMQIIHGGGRSSPDATVESYPSGPESSSLGVNEEGSVLAASERLICPGATAGRPSRPPHALQAELDTTECS